MNQIVTTISQATQVYLGCILYHLKELEIGYKFSFIYFPKFGDFRSQKFKGSESDKVIANFECHLSRFLIISITWAQKVQIDDFYFFEKLRKRDTTFVK